MGCTVAVVGVRQSPWGVHTSSLEDLIFDTVSGLLRQAGVLRERIDFIVLASSDQTDGRAISSMVTAGPAGGYMKDVINLSSSGDHAFVLAYLRLRAGLGSNALVVSWSKCSEASIPLVDNLAFEPFYVRRLGLERHAVEAMQAGVYRAKWGVPDHAAAAVVAKNRYNGARNANAHLRRPVSPEEVMQSPVVAWPLRELHLPPWSDGVCALLMTNDPSTACAVGERPAWVRGVGWASGSYWAGDDDLMGTRSLYAAVNMAYSQAGIRDPRKEIDVAEVHDSTPYHELMAYEALGFCRPGEGWRLAMEGCVSFGSDLPVNPSGGVLCSNPQFCAGLVRIAEAALQVMNAAGDHQVPGVLTAVAQAGCGIPGQNNTVVVLSAEPAKA